MLDGGGGADTLAGSSTGASVFTIDGADAGSLNTAGRIVRFVSGESLRGYGSADTFTFTTGGSLSGSVNGGGGADVLDYSLRTAGVQVNLNLGHATAVAGGVLNVTDVRGSAAADLLVGDALANHLIGNAGRDVLIGGAGGDMLDGYGEDDLLIAGTTSWDEQPEQLLAILAEWGRALPYATRLANLGGLLNDSTVRDDGAADSLAGGLGQDWYWAERAEVLDLERRTELLG